MRRLLALTGGIGKTFWLLGEGSKRRLLIGRNRDYGTTRGYPNESEFTYVKVRHLDLWR